MKKHYFLCGAVALLAGMFASCSQVDNAYSVEEEVFQAEITYDFAAEQALIAAGTVEKPGNFNGNQNNGQGFNAYSVKIRNDYKGYVKKDGSLLPEESHVWRRTDRFDQDASWNVEGGLNMPNNREMAIDGLEEGSVVVINYTAEEGKELVWAVGEKDADGNAVGVGEGTPVATATIDGVEAVSGETIIPSGAKIVMKSVTPAVKGTGYLVFKIQKGTVISKIEIGKMVGNGVWNAVPAE
jgi:hypothetical protein